MSGKAPTSHASSASTYGLGTTANYGHVKTINGLTQSSHSNGTALSAYQGYLLNASINSLTKDKINSNIANLKMYYEDATLTFSSGKASYSKNLSSFISSGTVRFAAICPAGTKQIFSCTIINGSTSTFGLEITCLDDGSLAGNYNIRLMIYG